MGSPKLIPKFSILNPVFTYTVPQNHTAAKVVDIMCHIFEQYFSPTPDTYLQDRMGEAILKTCIEYGPVAIKDPENYAARANLMWASTLALNGLLSTGKVTDWATHMIEHEVSAIHDTTHGIGLSIILPRWMEYVLDDTTVDKLSTYAENVWGITGEDKFEVARRGIAKTAEFFTQSLGLVGTLREMGVKEENLPRIAEQATARGPLGSFKKLNREDVLKILQKCILEADIKSHKKGC